jgi:hypothetical protein
VGKLAEIWRDMPEPVTQAQAVFQNALAGRMQTAFYNWDRIVKTDPCSYCGRPGVYNTFEHVKPKSQGGTRHFTNAASACRDCQLARGNAPLLAFLLARRLVQVRGAETRRVITGRIFSVTPKGPAQTPRKVAPATPKGTPRPSRAMLCTPSIRPRCPYKAYGYHYHCRVCDRVSHEPRRCCPMLRDHGASE